MTAPISGKIETMDIDVYDHVNQQGAALRYLGEGDKGGIVLRIRGVL